MARRGGQTVVVQEPGILGSMLRRYRQAAGLTQEELAERAGISARSVSDLERGLQRTPYPATTRRLVEALGLEGEARRQFESAAGRVHPVGTGYGEADTGPPISSVPPGRAAHRLRLDLPRRYRVPAAVLGAGLVLLVLGAAFLIYHGGKARPSGAPSIAGVPVPGWGADLYRSERFQRPEGIATGPHGDVYVVDAGADRIFRFSPASRLLAAWGSRGGGPGQLRSPRAIAVDGAGDTYVADTGNNRVEKFSAGGQLLATWNGAGVRGDRFRRPDSIAVDSQGRIYIGDWLNARIVELSGGGRLIRVLDNGCLNFCTLDTLAIAPPGSAAAGTVFIGEHDQIQAFPPGSPPHTVAVGLSFLGGLAPGAHALYFTTSLPAGVGAISPDGTIRRWRGSDLIGAIAVGRNGEVYAVDAARGRVERFSPAGRRLGGWGPRLSPQPLYHPQAVAVDARSNVYVADSGNARILKLSRAGHVLATWSPFGRSWWPRGVAVDSSGIVYVLDCCAVEILGQDGRPGLSWSVQQGVVQSGGIAVGDQGIYVTDAATANVVGYDAQGNLTAPSNAGGAGGSLDGSVAIALDGQGNQYVGETRRRQIDVYSPLAAPLRHWGARGSGPGQIRDLSGLAVDRQGRVYVADTGNNRIDVFSSTGTFLQAIGSVHQPRGVAVDAHDDVYVVDTAGSRIEKLIPAG